MCSKERCFHYRKSISERVPCPRRTARPRAAVACGAAFPLRRFSWGARLAHSRRTGNTCVRVGETAGVKATFWPEVKSGGAWLMAVSESKGQIFARECFRLQACLFETKYSKMENTIWSFHTEGSTMLINDIHFLGSYRPRKLVDCPSPLWERR